MDERPLEPRRERALIGALAANLLTLDGRIRSYGMAAGELFDLMLHVHGFHQGGHATLRQAVFLDDIAIDARP